jgi:putative transposase
MTRRLRIEFSGATYHVTSRGDRREAIFEDDEDRVMFLGVLAEVVQRFNWLCHAYCLMTNHYHLVIETPDGNLSKGMRQLNGAFRAASRDRGSDPSRVDVTERELTPVAVPLLTPVPRFLQ